MKILALESSGLVASVALTSDGKMIGEYTTNLKKTHSQTLLPMLDELVKTLEIDLNEIDAIAVCAGPGSFTGLRIGSATAKGLGLALKKPLIPVPTVDGLAYNLYGTERVICPLMDARRQQVYTGLYTFEKEEFKIISAQQATSIESIIEKVNTLGRSVIFLGDGVPVYKDVIAAQAKVDYSFAPLSLAYQRAGAVAALAEIYYQQGRVESASAHRPDYLRLSQAERELMEKDHAYKPQA